MSKLEPYASIVVYRLSLWQRLGFGQVCLMLMIIDAENSVAGHAEREGPMADLQMKSSPASLCYCNVNPYLKL
jgi:hypothetical protein